jgi:protein-L-isoaspartate(D-aspartate) O-methyltransferase
MVARARRAHPRAVLAVRAAVALVLCVACASGKKSREKMNGWSMARAQLVADLEAQGIRDARVLAAMRKVPRHDFVDEQVRSLAYEDHALPIAAGQTISQPYVVALMTELAALGPASRVLEIGTGSGYQAAVLAEVAGEVYTIEIVPELARTAAARLERLGYGRVHVRQGDGWVGWPEAAPFDAIVVTAAATEEPAALEAQLVPGGRLVIPVGDVHQELKVITRTERGLIERSVVPVRFVPITH